MIVQVSKGKYVVKLADFVKSKTWQNADGSASKNSRTSAKEGSISPEIDNPELDPKMDTFILGCYFYFVLSAGKHPFGDSASRYYVIKQVKLEKRSNLTVQDGVDKSLPKLTVAEAAKSLIGEMIERDLNQRLTMKQVLEHAYFNEGDEFYDFYGNKQVKPGLCIIFNNKIFVDEKVLKILS